ncbi:MAG: GDSL family lipase [Selenomonadaceae bacterium]|nr:GDSL family lipase [Selenomonadaceae bacterium]MBP3723022.1 GDSL family lipase [Selenomonadaceae bacterium]
MKHFLLFFTLIFSFSTVTLYLSERLDVYSLNYDSFNAYFEENSDGSLTLHWEKLNYPAYYVVETCQKTTGILDSTVKYHILDTFTTHSNSYKLENFSLPLYYRITAYGIFGRIGTPTEYLENPHFPALKRPIPIFRYDEINKASLMPFLVWHKVPTAVCYEFELLSGLPDSEGGVTLSKKNHLFNTREIFTNGYQADLRKFSEHKHLYYRVRALGLHHEPIGEFSEAQKIVTDKNLPFPNRPLVNDFDVIKGYAALLYPVFDFIPLNGIKRYEVELLTEPPKMPNNAEPTANRVWFKILENSITAYDEYPRPYAGAYYFRVRAIDSNGNTIGVYSDTKKFEVKEYKKRARLAVFGDSITHGGGAVSYSPASLEYSYNTYLDIPAINLGRSGDTSATSLERLERDVSHFKPKNLLILTGTNSLRTPTISAKEVIGDIDEMEKICVAKDIRPIFLTLMPINPQNILFAFQAETDPKWREKLKKINDHIKSKNYFIDLEPYFYDEKRENMDTEFSIDGLHPDIKGKMLMAEIINLHKHLIRE